MITPAYDQTDFRGRNDDGGEAGATWIDAANTNWTQFYQDPFRIRYVVAETNGGGENNTTWQLQYNLNAAGWNDVSTTSSVVQAVSSTHFADGDATTQQLGSGTFVSGEMADDGLSGDVNNVIDFSGNDETEVEYSLDFVDADVADGDTVEFRVRKGDGTTISYTNTPTVTVDTTVEVTDLANVSAAASVGVADSVPGRVSWVGSADWDGVQSETGVVHENTTNTDHTDASTLKQGYPVASPEISSGLVGFWPFHEDSGSTAFEFSGNNNDGTVNGTPFGATGLFDTTSYQFDGTSVWVDVGNQSAYSFSGDYAWVFLINKSTAVTDRGSVAWDEVVLQSRPGDTGYTITFDEADNGLLRYQGEAADSFDNLLGSTDLTDGVWHHVVCQYNSGTMEMYVDNALDGSLSSTHDPSSVDPLVFGDTDDNGGRYLDARLAGIWAYNRALSATEIETHYNVVGAAGTHTTSKKVL